MTFKNEGYIIINSVPIVVLDTTYEAGACFFNIANLDWVPLGESFPGSGRNINTKQEANLPLSLDTALEYVGDFCPFEGRVCFYEIERKIDF